MENTLMNIKYPSLLFAALVCMLCMMLPNVSFASIKYDHNPNIIEELRVRDGLPNVFKKLETRQPVNVIYLGGSITHAKGWRPKTFAWLESQFPHAKLTHIPQGKGMVILVSTDGSVPAPIASEQTEKALYARFANLPELAQGNHTTTVTVSKLPENATFYAGQLLLLRDPMVEN